MNLVLMRRRHLFGSGALLILSASLFVISGGCISKDFELGQTQLVGNAVLTSLKTETKCLPFYAHSPTVLGKQYYLLSFPIAETEGKVVAPDAVGRIKFLNELKALFSPQRALLLTDPTLFGDWNEWTATITERKNDTWKATRSWGWNRGPTTYHLSPAVMDVI
jgi:hypothetical protein